MEAVDTAEKLAENSGKLHKRECDISRYYSRLIIYVYDKYRTFIHILTSNEYFPRR
jgi:hypothetical protein